MDKTEQIFEHAWRHFTVHSAQRMQHFNYAITMSAAIYATLVAADEFDSARLGQVAAALGVGATFAFWNLDRRTRRLVHHSEAALKKIEQELSDGDDRAPIALFHASDRKTFGSLSYTSAFTLLFVCNVVAMTALGFPLVREAVTTAVIGWVSGLF
ncbi:MAG: hypothetical protein JNL81_13160 [Hyphomonadaceae bacterium]|nr:hypothetical protein [Hyphomonadaceae bacterium]